MYWDNTYIYGKYSDFKQNIDFEINSIHIMYRNKKAIVFFQSTLPIPCIVVLTLCMVSIEI